MPRLLLVDDNPSIHRIAESLLAPTDVELVCVDSAAEALDRIGQGERFDVALVDTAMPGMDGWTLLERLRAMEATAQLPIALMAGVLDPVDPAKLARASIQGFLKKPIELRELGDRVKALLATPVPPPALSPFATAPAMPAKDLVKRAEAALPELRPEALPVSAQPSADEDLLDSAFADLDFLEEAPPTPAPTPAPGPSAELEADLLLLSVEDLWPEETVPTEPEAVEALPEPALPDMHLELEELDLDSLQDLTDDLPGEPAEEPFSHSLAGLEPLDAQAEDFALIPVPAPEPLPEPVVEQEFHALPAAALAAGAAGAASLAALALLGQGEPAEPAHPEPAHPEPAHPEPAHTEPAHTELAHTEPAPLPVPVVVEAPAPAMPVEAAAGGHPPAAPGQAGLVSHDQAQALVQALLADPVLVDALVKAVVARMGDQVIREIAWEVMPDLAGRLQR